MTIPKITPDYALLHSLLTRPIAFHRVFVTISGSVLAGLMLSQAYYWTPRGESDDGWFYKTQAEWEEETGMSRWEQETARKKLLQIKTAAGEHVWQEERRGVPAKLFYRVSIPALFECIFGEPIDVAIKNGGSPQSSMLESHILEGGNPTDKTVAKPQSFYTETTTDISAQKQKRPPTGAKSKSPKPYHPDEYGDVIL